MYKRDVVDQVVRDAVVDLELPQTGNQGGADDAGDRPRGDQPAMDRADHLRAEDVGEIGRHRREAAAIHASG